MPNLIETHWTRLEKVIAWSGLSVYGFAQSIGLKRAENLYRIKNGKNGLSKRLIDTITEKYPRISDVWLVTGSGEMLLDEDAERETAPETLSFIPFFPFPAELGARTSTRFSIPIFGKDTLATIIDSDTLSPKIKKGNIVFVRHIEKEKIVYGECYLVCINGQWSFAEVHPNDNESILLKSVKNESYHRILPLHDISELYLICGSLEKFI